MVHKSLYYLITLTLVGIVGCDAEKTKQVSQTQPQSIQIQAPAQPVPTPPKIEKEFNPNTQYTRTFMDSDPEYYTLVNEYVDKKYIAKGYPNSYIKFYEKYSPSYVKDKTERDERVKAFIASKTSGLDDSLKRSMASNLENQAKEKFPEIKLEKYNKEAFVNFQKKIDDFKNRNEDKLFLVASYENYNSKTHVCCFGIQKFRKRYCEFDPVRMNEKIPTGTPVKSDDELKDIHAFGVIGGGDVVDESSVISGDSGRWKADWVGRGNYAYALTMKIPLETMNSVYSSVSSIHSASIDGIYNTELSFGSYYCAPLGREVPYSAQHIAERLKKLVVSFVRRNSIMLAGKGDPFEFKIKECRLIVLGDDKVYKDIR